MPAVPPPWAFFGLLAGPWKLALIAALALAFWGRSAGARRLWSALRPTSTGRRLPLGRILIYGLLALALAFAAWVVTWRALSGSRPG